MGSAIWLFVFILIAVLGFWFGYEVGTHRIRKDAEAEDIWWDDHFG